MKDQVVNAAPLFSWRGAGLALILSVLLCWPIFVTGADFVFPDSESYIHGGYRIWTYAFSAVDNILGAFQTVPTGPVPGGVAYDLTQAENGISSVGRSFVYSAFAAATYVGLGTLGVAVAQGWVVVMALFALIGPRAMSRPGRLVGGAAFLALISSLPWYIVYLMPDIFAAVPIVFAAALLVSFDGLTRGQQIGLTAIAAFTTASHYGTSVLAVGIIGFAVLWRILARQWSGPALLAALVAVSTAPIANLTASAVVLEKASMAPQRLPILLARSIDDGPALWYLRDVCPDADWAVCRIFGTDIPDNAGAFLWTSKGIENLGDNDMAAIRQEELPLLGRVFLAYPLAQSEALFGNSVRQMFLVGTDNIRAVDRIVLRNDPGPVTTNARGEHILDAADTVMVWTTAAMMLVLLGLVSAGRLDARQVRIMVTILTGLVFNAIVFGGLSAPVERYQARVVWLVPFMACLFLAEWRPLRVTAVSPLGGLQK